MFQFADVILPLPLSKYYTYRIPEELQSDMRPGCRVIVPFGRKKYYTAIVVHIHPYAPADYETKDILTLLDESPILRRPQLKFWEWIAEYYLCSVGDVYKAALPSGLKLESETLISPNPDYEEDEDNRLKDREAALLDTLSRHEKISVQDLEKESGLRNILPIVRTLLDKEAVFVSEQVKTKYRPKTEVYIKMSFGKERRDELRGIFEQLSSVKKQLKLLMAYIDMSGFMQRGELREVSKKELLKRADVTSVVLNGLLAKGILVSYTKEISRIVSMDSAEEAHHLNEFQKKALEDIISTFHNKDVTLLHGVTSSGKTEVYIHLIQEVLKQNRQVLYLVPEIALTTQLTGRLQKVFGKSLAIYHSKFSDNERVEVWNSLLLDKGIKIILGVRSSIFLPFKDLGLVIVDEEHENTYKQQDPAPRYHARNAALVLAGMHGAKTLLGSATPSIDSYFNATTGKYGLVELTTRYGDRLMPEILTVDIKELRRKKIMKDTLFSPVLVEKLSEALGKGEQVILFQNRRGFAPVIECKECGWVPHCVNCDVSLTYHKFRNELVCHYCGYKIQLPHQCPECQSLELRTMGFGTEMVEEEIATLFPSAKVERLDFDTARTRAAYERIIADFEKGKTQILIGTQMLSKGLDFGNVSVVGILNADSLMNFPDFRAHERAFQLMVQVSGRAGRRDKRGTVVLQTSQPDHPLIRMVERFAYKEMVRLQLGERSMFRYPPYYRLIVIVLRSRNDSILQELSVLYAENLRRRLGERVLGPVTPPITRVQTLHIRKIVLKIEIAAAIAPVREILESVHTEMQRYLPFKQLIVHYDVDPA